MKKGLICCLVAVVWCFLFLGCDRSVETSDMLEPVVMVEETGEPRIAILSEDPKIGVEKHGNLNKRTYHIKAGPIEIGYSWYSNLSEISKSDSYNKLNQMAKDLVKDALAVKGVAQVWINKYYIMVERSPIYEWDEIEPQIVEVIKAACQPKGESV